MKKYVFIFAAIACCILAIGAGNAKANVTDGGGGSGDYCTVFDTIFYGDALTDGTIGYLTQIACSNVKARIQGTSCLRAQVYANGVWGIVDCISKTTYGGQIVSAHYKCGFIANLPNYEYDGGATWGVTFPDGYTITPDPSDWTPPHASYCGPTLVRISP